MVRIGDHFPARPQDICAAWINAAEVVDFADRFPDTGGEFAVGCRGRHFLVALRHGLSCPGRRGVAS